MLYIGLPAQSQCGGLDILIANDQSGSVDAWENQKSREFITSFAQGLTLAYNAGGFRIAIADWDYSQNWKQFDFPGAGKDYTASFSDIVAYANAPRVLSGGTDLVMALQKAYQNIQADADKTRPKVILLMTDAQASSMIQPGLVDLAEQVKNSGIYIAVLAIESAQYYPSLPEVASTGGFFPANSYEELAADAAAFAKNIAAAACKGNQPAFDLGIELTAFNAAGCFPGPGTFTIEYTIRNTGKKLWDDDVVISLYNTDPSQYVSKPIGVFHTGKLALEAGAAYSGTYSSAGLSSYQAVTAIVNFDGIASGIAMPAYSFQIMPLLVVKGEKSSANNFSNPVSRTNQDGCIPKASVTVDVTAENAACDQAAGYTVRICNTGNQDTRLKDLLPVPDQRFSLRYTDNDIDSINTAYYNTYFGGSNADYAYSAAMDKFGFIYITGQTNSNNNIVTPGAYRSNTGNSQDAFLAKFNTAGKRIWATYFGGPGPENGYSIATDKEGNVYITGETSNSPNIATGGSFQIASGGSYDAYLAKFDANGTLLWSTYYGGSGADYGRAVAVDSHGNVYLAGNTASANAVATAGAHQSVLGGGTDAFLVKFSKDGVRKWSTYYGGTGTESGFGVAVDANDNVYLTGLSSSTGNIATAAGFQTTKSTGNDAYLVKFDSNGVRKWGTYFGGNNSDNATSINIDHEDRIYISGNTSSTNVIATAFAHQAVNNSNTDAFIARFDTSGNRIWSTFYGGTGTDNGRQVYTDNAGFVYLSGNTTSTGSIATANGIQTAYGGNTDAFLVKFDNNGVQQWGTYFGGTESDIASATVTDAAGKLYMTGATQSLQIATDNSFQQQYGGGTNDAFLLKIDEQSSFILKAGKCINLHYYYDVAAAPAAQYDFSYSLSTEKILDGDPDAEILPDSSGFDGTKHTADNITVLNNTPACAPGDKIKITATIPPITSCGTASFATATLVIDNTSGVTIRNAVLTLQLDGTGAFCSSELYGLSNGLLTARPDISDPLYPNVQYALLNKSGQLSIPLYEIPPGENKFSIDLAVGSSTISFAAQVTGIASLFNATGQSNTATVTNAITLTPLPAINGWNVPASVTEGETIQINNLSTVNAYSLQWVSATAGKLANNGTLQQPALVYTPSAADIANGYIMLSLTILNEAGCDVSQTAYISITNVQYDYGDAPVGYDLLQQKVPYSAASTLSNGLYLGRIAPSSETVAKNSADATGDGVEEDGLQDKCPLQPVVGKNYILTTAVTNNTVTKAYLHAFIDWNNDGDFLDSNETALQVITIPAASGVGYYAPAFKVPEDINNTHTRYFVRLRLSQDSAAIRKPYGPAAGGETEDHLLIIKVPSTSTQEKTICQGDSVIVGQHIYKQGGHYYDTVTAYNGCDSIIHTILSVNACGENECGPFVPNAFTPNGDGNNDNFRVTFRCPVNHFSLSVYNRWGQKVFESNDPKTGWDGRIAGVAQASGSFIWYCRYERDGISQVKKGTVTLVR